MDIKVAKYKKMFEDLYADRSNPGSVDIDNITYNAKIEKMDVFQLLMSLEEKDIETIRNRMIYMLKKKVD